MKEQIISYETAVLAKEKGFGLYEDSKRFYISGKLRNKPTEHMSSMRERFLDICAAPEQSLLQKWLREVHKITVEITLKGYITYQTSYIFQGTPYTRPDGSNIEGLWNHVTVGKYEGVMFKNTLFDTYEQALEAGLQEALKLIK